MLKCKGEPRGITIFGVPSNLIETPPTAVSHWSVEPNIKGFGRCSHAVTHVLPQSTMPREPSFGHGIWSMLNSEVPPDVTQKIPLTHLFPLFSSPSCCVPFFRYGRPDGAFAAQVDARRINKPFVEKPVDRRDRDIYAETSGLGPLRCILETQLDLVNGCYSKLLAHWGAQNITMF